MASRLVECNDEELRNIADKAAMLALNHTGGIPPQVEDLRNLSRQEKFGDSRQRSAVEELANKFDDIYWRTLEETDGSIETSGNMEAFSRARALTSAWSCADPEPLQAALDACYEAIIAVDDADAIQNEIWDQ